MNCHNLITSLLTILKFINIDQFEPPFSKIRFITKVENYFDELMCSSFHQNVNMTFLDWCKSDIRIEGYLDLVSKPFMLDDWIVLSIHIAHLCPQSNLVEVSRQKLDNFFCMQITWNFKYSHPKKTRWYDQYTPHLYWQTAQTARLSTGLIDAT